MNKFIVALLFNCLFVCFAVAQQQMDHDQDGLSDITLLTESSDNFLWKSNLSTDTTDLSKTFGLATDFPVPAYWQNSSSVNLAVVRSTSANKLEWRILKNNSLLKSKIFGASGNLAFSGADFDGNLVNDAAVISLSSSKLKWVVKRNFFAASGLSTKTFILGKSGDRVTFANLDGDRDWACAFGRSHNKSSMLAKDLENNERRVYTGFSNDFSSPTVIRPVPIRRGNGKDYLAFITEDETETKVTVYRFIFQNNKYLARIVRKLTFNGTGTVVIGEFDTDTDGEEIAFLSSSETIIVNPTFETSEVKAVLTGTPYDQINIGTP